MIHLTELKKDYFMNLDKIDNAIINLIWKNGLSLERVGKVKIELTINDNTYYVEIEK